MNSDSHPQASFDEDGFLLNRSAWDKALAEHIADKEGIQLQQSHWQIIFLVQQYYDEFDLSPAMRPLIKYLNQQLDIQVNSIYLLKLFPGSPAKLVSKIAGLPKPEHCL